MKFIEKAKIEFEQPIIIEAFPGTGLVGSIAAFQIIKELNLKYFGYFEIEGIPPLVTVEKGIPYPPVRAYAKNDLIILFSDVIIPPLKINELAEFIVKTFSNKNPKLFVSLGGIVAGKSEKVFGIANKEELIEDLKNYVEIFDFGIVGGISGNLLIKCQDNGFDAIGLLAETVGVRPDPRGGANLLEVLNKMFNLNISIENLIKEAEAIENKLKELAEQHLKMMSKSRKEYPMYI
ncbi:proteasome assembly chaperone family protein [Methanocaldococcus sp. 16A]